MLIILRMQTRTLGKDGDTIGEVGLGCWQFGGDFGPMADQTALGILAAAVASGTDFFDTADVYGAGRSEELIGRFLKTSGATVKVATKVGRSGTLYPDKYTRLTVRESLCGSLRRLGLEAIDLIQLHCVPTGVLRDGEIFEWLRDFKQAGLIREFGASVESVVRVVVGRRLVRAGRVEDRLESEGHEAVAGRGRHRIGSLRRDDASHEEHARLEVRHPPR